MTTSAPMSLKSASSLEDEKLTAAQIGYLKGDAQNRAHEVVLKAFLEESASNAEVSRAFMARRLGKDASQITKFLGASGNWTLETLALLLGAIGRRPTFGSEKISEQRWANDYHPLTRNKPYVMGQAIHTTKPARTYPPRRTTDVVITES